MDLSQYKQLLTKFLAFKSISTDSAYKQDTENCANWLESTLESFGFTAKLIFGKNTNPYLFAEYKVSDDAETILIYGHYDVQPADVNNGWTADPFTLTEIDGHYLGRGVVDNKGQVLIHIFTIAELIKEGNLKYNIKFFIEGNEETGNEEIRNIIEKNKDLLACDYVLLSDGETTAGRPTLDVGLRGGCNLTLKYKTADNNLHSGIYGGAVPNAAHELSILISKFYSTDNEVQIPDFYQGVEGISQDVGNANKSLEFTERNLSELTGARAFMTEKDYDFYTQTGLRPMLTVTGFRSGYIGDGYSNIVPAEAEIKINFRFVADQDPDFVIDKFEEFVKQNTPDYVDFSLERDQSWRAIKMDINTPKFQEVANVLAQTYEDEVFYKYVGGSIPVILDFKEIFGVDVISVSLANEDCNMHGVDENFDLNLLEKGLRFSRRFFSGK